LLCSTNQPRHSPNDLNDLRGSPIRNRILKATLLSFCACFCCLAHAWAQQTPASLNANNTSACPASGRLPAHCHHPFGGQNDTRPQVATPQFDIPAGNVSDEDPHAYLTQGAGTKIFANIMLGFCTTSESGECHNNVQVGYASNDARTVAAQVTDIKRRHIDGAILTWEGAGTSEDSAALKIQSYLNANDCTGPQSCNPMYLIMYDGPSTGYTVTPTGIAGTTGASCLQRGGADYENCVIAHIRNDMCYLNGKHWGNNAYQKLNGRPVLQIFPEEGVIAEKGAAPSWTDVWVHIAQWNNDLPHNCSAAPFNADNGVPLLVFENAGACTHQASSGAYYWIKPAGTDPQRDQLVANISPSSIQGSLDNFYEISLQHPNYPVWGGAFKGFNSSLSSWGPDRIMDQQCGQVWLQSLTESNKYYTTNPLPYLQIATWNDYNEGTEIETGIDNCFTVNARIEGSELVWSLDSGSNNFANVSTISHIEIYDSRDGRHLVLLGEMPAALTGRLSLQDKAFSGRHMLYVRMVGKNSILNRLSPPVEFSRKS
jgi:hypothetical protein